MTRDRAVTLRASVYRSAHERRVSFSNVSTSARTGFSEHSRWWVLFFSSVSIHVYNRWICTLIAINLFLRVSTSIIDVGIRPSVPLRNPRMCICCCWLRYVVLESTQRNFRLKINNDFRSYSSTVIWPVAPGPISTRLFWSVSSCPASTAPRFLWVPFPSTWPKSPTINVLQS